jgi:1-acyl-sn-glycerol-3-phosphate acyltransferase
MLRTKLFKIALGIWFTAWSPLLLVGLVSKNLSKKFIEWDAYGVLLLSRWINGIKYEVHGTPAKNVIVAAKHMSILEIAILKLKVYPKSFFIIKKELMMIPIYGWAFWRIGYIGVNRKPGATNMKVLADKAAKKIRAGETLVIFPEGTRAKPGDGVHLRRGLLFIAETAKIQIQPVGTDTGLYWPKHGMMHSGTANVWLEPVLPYTASLDDIANAIARHSA